MTDIEQARQTIADALNDCSYLAGVKAGWDAAHDENPEAAYASLSESRGGHLAGFSEAKAVIKGSENPCALWLPIAEMVDKCDGIFLIAAPELVDDDWNPEGVNVGWWQDDEGWKSTGWNNSQDYSYDLVVNPTNFQRIKGPYHPPCLPGPLSAQRIGFPRCSCGSHRS